MNDVDSGDNGEDTVMKYTNGWEDTHCILIDLSLDVGGGIVDGLSTIIGTWSKIEYHNW